MAPRRSLEHESSASDERSSTDLPISQDCGLSQTLRERGEAREALRQVHNNARIADVQATMGPRSEELENAARTGTTVKAPPPKKAGGKAPSPKAKSTSTTKWP